MYNPRRSGNVYAIDGIETFVLHNHLRTGEIDFESVDRNASIRTILGVGADFQYEVISKEDWIGRRLVADKLRERRIFICGDAAHLWVPMGGHGVNAGIANAMDSFTPSTVPGCRKPHVWLADGRSLYGAMGDGFALLRTDPQAGAGPLLDAAKQPIGCAALRVLDMLLTA